MTYLQILEKNLENLNLENRDSQDDVKTQYIKYKNFLDTDENIRHCDHINGLDMYCYNSCNNKDSLAVKFARGVVYKGQEMVASSLPYTVQFNCNDRDGIHKFLEGINPKNIKAFPSYEGTLIRMFNVDDIWYVSTHRRFDAFTCTWGPSKKSFGTIFIDALKNTEMYEKVDDPLKRLEENLNKDSVYLFLVLSTIENRLVSNPNPPLVYFVGNIKENCKLHYDGVKGITSIKELEFKDIDHLIDIAKESDYRTSQGVILYLPNMVQVKIFSSDYLYRFNLRNNEPSINYRYLQLAETPERQQEFRELYPEHCASFDEYEKYIDIICKNLFELYKKRYIQGQYIKTEPQKHWVLKKCHEKSEEGETVDLALVKSVLFLQNASVINKFIKELKFAK